MLTPPCEGPAGVTRRTRRIVDGQCAPSGEGSPCSRRKGEPGPTAPAGGTVSIPLSCCFRRLALRPLTRRCPHDRVASVDSRSTRRERMHVPIVQRPQPVLRRYEVARLPSVGTRLVIASPDPDVVRTDCEAKRFRTFRAGDIGAHAHLIGLRDACLNARAGLNAEKAHTAALGVGLRLVGAVLKRRSTTRVEASRSLLLRRPN